MPESLRLLVKTVSAKERERIRRQVGSEWGRQFFDQLRPGTFRPGADFSSMANAISQARPDQASAINLVAKKLGYDRDLVEAVWQNRKQE